MIKNYSKKNIIQPVENVSSTTIFIRLLTSVLIMIFSMGAYFNAQGQCKATVTSNAASICPGDAANLTTTITNATGPFTYSWAANTPGLTLSDLKIANPVAKPIVTTNYIVTVNGGGCTNVKGSISITVNPLPNPVITGAVSVCQGSKKNIYSVVNVPGNSYFWTVTGGTFDGMQNTNEVTVDWVAAGTGTLTVTETNPTTGCKKSVTKSITINALPVVTFTSAPVGDACSARYKFTTTSPATAPGLTYKWTFNDKSAPETTRDPIHQFHPHGDAFQNIITTLIVKNSAGCVDSTKQTINNVKQRPDASLSAPTFKQCAALGPFTLKITNNSSTKTTNKNYQIIWGDGTAKLDLGTTFSAEITHTYSSIGSFDLKFIVTGTNNCIDTVSYLVFNGSNPGLGVTSPGNTTGCTNGSSCFTFNISGFSSNVETNYTFDFGDDSPIENYTQAELTLKPSLEHCYLKPSCDRPNSEYILTARAINECKLDGTKGEFNSIIVSAPPESKFTNPENACIGVPLTFSNTSSNGCYVYAGVPSIKAYNRWWVDGVLVKYDPYVDILPNLVHTFTTAGLHNVCLVTWNDCSPDSRDSICQEICISPLETAGFDLDIQDGCSPLEVSATNTSVTGSCVTPVFNWTVSYDDLACPPNTSSWSFTSGTDASTKDPVFQFDNPGIYTITLTIANGCGTGTALTMSKKVTVKGKPTVTALTPADIYLCLKGQSQTFAPTFTTNCDKPAEPYLWEITPTPATAVYSFTGGSTNKSEKPTVVFADYGDYLVKGTVKNGCGENSTTQTIHVAKPIADNKIAITTPAGGEMCAGQASTAVLIEGPVPTDGIAPFSYQWQENLNCDFTASGIWADIPTAGTSQNYSLGSLSATRCFRRIVKDKGNCPSPSDPVQVLYKEIKNNDIGNSQQICKNTAPALLTGSTAIAVGGTVTYQWEQSADETTNYTPINLTNTLNYQPLTLSATTYFRRAVITSSCPPNYSTPVKITVVDPISNNTISSDLEICQGTKPATFTTSTPTGGGGTYTYEWQAATEASYPTFTTISGATEATYSPPEISEKTYFRRIVSSPANNCTNSISTEFIISTLSIPNVKITGPTTALNNGSSVTLLGNTTGGNLPYSECHWTPELYLKSPYNDCAKATTVNLDAGREFTLTVTDAKGCKGVGKAFVDIQGDALSFKLYSNPTIICPGDLVNLWGEATGGSGDYEFKWTGGGNSYFTSAFDVNLNSTTTFTCVVTDKQTGVVSAPLDITVDVSPRPVVTSVLTAEICSGDLLNYTPTADVAGSTFIWKSDPGVNYSGNTNAPSPGKNIIEDKLINLGSADETVHYILTPRRPDAPYCEGSPVDLYVKIKPEAQITNAIMKQTVISGFESVPVTFTSNVKDPGLGFLWKFIPESGCLGFVQTALTEGDSPTLDKQIITLLPGAPSSCTINYTVTPYVLSASGDKCLGSPYIYQYIINSKPTDYNLICPTPFCKGQTGTISLDGTEAGIEYRLYRGSTFVGPMISGTGSSISWTGISTAGSYTVIATNPINGQSATMSGMCQVVINELPAFFLLTPQNGEHCAPVIPLLSGSEAGISYKLINNGNINIPAQVKTGSLSGGFLTFDALTDAGTYTVIALNPLTGCEREMLGNFKVDPVIKQFPVYPGGVLCEGVDLCMDGSEPEISYQLWLNNVPFGAEIQGDANGNAVCFGTPTVAGTYRIHAKNKLTDCELFFDKSYIVNPLPKVFVMSPVEGCPGSEITLNNCEDGIAYYLSFIPKKGPTPKKTVISDPVFCTGSGKISFGQVYDEGVYLIKAVSLATNCTVWMNGSTNIHPEPQAYNMIPQGTACPPVSIKLDNFDQDATYYLYRNGDTLAGTDDALDNEIDFGPQTLPGIYTVRAQFVFPGDFECWNTMNGSLRIYHEPVKYTLLPSGPLCPPAKLFLNGSEAGVTYTLWHDTYGIRQVIPGNGGNLQFKAENEPGNYWVEAKTSNNCLLKMNGTILVHPKKVYSVLPSGLGLCEPALIGLDGSDKNSTYELLHSDGTSLVPPEIHIATSDGAFSFTNPQPAGSYIVKATNQFGCDTIMKGIATVHPQPTVDAGKIADPICSPPAISVQLTGIATDYSSVEWTSPTNPTGSNFSDPNSLTPVYTFTEADKLNKIVTLTLTAKGTGICAGASNSSPITIHLQAPIVNAGADQIVCENSAVTLSGSVSGGTNTGIWSGGLGTFDNPNSLSTIYHPDASETGTDVILTLTSTNASPCPDLADNISIRILNPLFYGNAGSNQTICYGETPAKLIAELPSGGSDTLNLTYQWQYLAGNGSTWQNVSSGGDSRFYSPGPLTVTTSFRLQQTDNYCSPTKTVTTNVVKITVYDQLKAATASSNQTICYGETPAKLLSAEPQGGSGTLNFSYQWQFSTDTEPWTNVPSAGNTLEYSPGFLQTTTYYRLQQTDSYCTLNKTVATNTVTVKVHNQLQAGKTSTDQVICYGETPAPLTAEEPLGGSGSVNFTYQWQFSTDGGISWANVPGGGNSLTYLTGPLTVSTSYRLQQTDPFCSPDDVVLTNPITVTVYDQLFAGTATTDQTMCYGETPLPLSATKPTGGSGNFEYQWQFSTNGGISWANVTSNGTALDYSPPALLLTTQYRLRQTDSYCPGQVLVTNAVIITVHNQLIAGTVSPDQTICYGEIPALLSATLPNGGSGTFTYQWQISTDAGTTWAAVSAGGISLTYSPGPLSNTSMFRLLQTDTYCTPDQVATTSAITITVNKQLVAGSAASDQTICYGETPAPLTATEPSGGSGSMRFAYQWQYSTDGEITWTDVASGGKSLNYSPPSLTLTTSYRLKQWDTYCSPYQVVYTNTVTLTVHIQLVAGIASTNQTICYGETPAMLSSTLPAGGSGSFLYQWQFSVNGGITWANIVSAGTSLTYSPASLLVTTAYRLQQTDTYCTPDQVVTTNQVTITVHKQLVAGTAGAEQTICYGAVPATLKGTVPTGGSGNYSYQWQVLSDTNTWENIDGAISIAYTPPSLFASVSYRLLQRDTFCNTNQEVITNIVTIHVQIPTAFAGPDETVCGLVPFALTHGSADFAVNYTWSTSGNGSFGNQYQLNSTYFPSPADMSAGSVVLTLTISDKCNNVVTDDMTLTLSQQAVAFFSFNSPVCTGSPVQFDDLSTAGSGSVVQWTWNFGDGSPAETVSFPNNPNISHSFAKAGTFAVTLTVTNSYGCSDDFIAKVTLLPAPIANFQYLHPCENSLVTFADASLSNGAGKVISWKWEFDDPLTGIDNTSTLKDPSHIFSEGNKTYNVSLTIVNYNNCSATMVKQVFIRNAPAVDYSYSKTCLNELVNFVPDSQTMNFDSISTWHWEFGDGTVSNERDAAHRYPAAGIYTAVLHVVDITGCENFISKNITISQPPIANFNTGDLNCTGSNVHFNELASTLAGYIVKWTWDFGDGNTQTVQHPDNPNVDHIYINSGKYTVTLNIENSEGCTAKVSYPVTVKQSPNANFEFTNPVAAGSPVQFTDLTQVYGGGTLLSWNWDFGNPTSGNDNTSTYQNPLHVFNLGGSYNVTLVARSINTCADTVTKTMTIIGLPSVVFTADTVCQGLPTHFTDLTLINNGTIDSWNWNFGDGSTGSSQKNPEHTFASSGIYTVKLRIMARIEGILVPDSSTMSVEVMQGPVAGFTTGITCFGQETGFTNTSTSPGSPIDSYAWIFDDPTTVLDISSAIQPKYTYPEAGGYTVQLVAVNSMGCSDTTRNQVIINKLPVADLSLADACTKNPVVLRDLSQQGDSPLISWHWEISGPNGYLQFDSLQNPVVVFTQAGSHNIKLTVKDADGCQSVTNRKTTINTSPASAFSFTENYENEQGRVLLNNETQDATRYVWDFGNGSYSSEQNPVANYTADGEYSISLVAFNSLNCPDTLKKTYNLLFKGLYIPTAFSPNNPSAKLNLFKPAGVNLKSYKIEVFNKWGQIIWSSDALLDGQPTEGWDGKFQGENMPIGVYLWKASAVFKDDSVWEGQNTGNNDGLSEKTFGTVILIK